MAPSEPAQPETNTSTPTSPHHSAGGDAGLKASKDRKCPFCHQPFTSSSLGRHLDLYIKPKNPKPPDGIHDVGEIRKMRGNITRRQPRSGAKGGNATGLGHAGRGGEEDDGRESEGTPESERVVAHARGRESNGDEGGRGAQRVVHQDSHSRGGHSRENERGGAAYSHNWHATGVITNIPPSVQSSRETADGPTPGGQAQRMQEMRRDGTGQVTRRPEFEGEGMRRLEEAAEVGRAAELALREVLSSLRAAKRRLQPATIFDDIDFFSLSFPGLCLSILPAPTTLFTQTPFAAPDTFTLLPPGPKQRDSLNRQIHEHARDKNKTQAEPVIPTAMIFRHCAHLEGAFEHWMDLKEQDRASAWSLETLRAYTRLRDRTTKLTTDLETAQNRIKHLEDEYDRLARCQLPREYLLHPPHTVPAPGALLKEMSTENFTSPLAEENYDPDALLAKWRTAVNVTKRRRPHHFTEATTTGTTTTPDAHTVYAPEGSGKRLGEDIIMQSSVWAVNGIIPREQQDYHHHQHKQADTPGVDYETPPQPGLVVSVADDDDHSHTATRGSGTNGTPRRSGRDEISQQEKDHYYGDDQVVGRRMQAAAAAAEGQGNANSTYSPRMDGGLNSFGKRPLQGSAMSGGRSGTPGSWKVYREQ